MNIDLYISLIDCVATVSIYMIAFKVSWQLGTIVFACLVGYKRILHLVVNVYLLFHMIYTTRNVLNDNGCPRYEWMNEDWRKNAQTLYYILIDKQGYPLEIIVHTTSIIKQRSLWHRSLYKGYCDTVCKCLVFHLVSWNVWIIPPGW